MVEAESCRDYPSQDGSVFQPDMLCAGSPRGHLPGEPLAWLEQCRPCEGYRVPTVLTPLCPLVRRASGLPGWCGELV